MSALKIHAHVGSDGVLSLRLPPDYREAAVSVTVEREAGHADESANESGRSAETWPEFLRRISGSISDPSFERPPQGEVTPREPLD